MTEPLALVFYEKMMPGSQLVNRLQSLHYRVQTCNEAATLADKAQEFKPMVLIADLFSRQNRVKDEIKKIKSHADTAHIPIIVFASGSDPSVDEELRAAGASRVVPDSVVLQYLPQLLEQALNEF